MPRLDAGEAERPRLSLSSLCRTKLNSSVNNVCVFDFTDQVRGGETMGFFDSPAPGFPVKPVKYLFEP
eukprot:7379153-Prymnesium_polylepis.1